MKQKPQPPLADATGEKSPDLLVRLEADRDKTKAKIKRYQDRLRDLDMLIARVKRDREVQKHGTD